MRLVGPTHSPSRQLRRLSRSRASRSSPRLMFRRRGTNGHAPYHPRAGLLLVGGGSRSNPFAIILPLS